jgi:hypothetical protein
MVFGSWTRSSKIPAIPIYRQIVTKMPNCGLSPQLKRSSLPDMVRGTTSRGTKKCRKFTSMVNSVHTMLVITTALRARYCVLDHHRNGSSYFVNRSPVLQ